MAHYYKFVNPAKREFIDPIDLGDGFKYRNLFDGGLTSEAIKILINDQWASRPDRQESPPWSLAGAWVGDPVIIASDDGSDPNPAGIQTATRENPNRNLYQMAAEEYTNIALRVLAMFCEFEGRARELVARSESDSMLFMHLADLMMQAHEAERLRTEFLSRFGTDWRARYDELLRQRPDYSPLSVW